MANPTLSKFDQIDFGNELEQGKTMTVHGTAAKTGVLLALAFVTAALAWRWGMQDPALVMPLALGGGIVAIIFALIGTFFPKSAPFTAPLYALCEGLALGAISMVVNAMITRKTGENSGLQNIVLQAVLLTFGVMAGVLALYGFRIIKVTGKVMGAIFAATAAVAIFYLVTMVLGMFGVHIAALHGSGWLSIGISAVIIVIAAANLLIDFHFIEKGAKEGAPKYMEWFGALGLMVTLVWLYFEILNLLSKLNSRN